MSEQHSSILERCSEAQARVLIEAFLDKEAPGYPTYSLIEDGRDVWAFWIVDDDTTSYLSPDGRIQWSGTGWPELYAYDGETGRWLDVPVADEAPAASAGSKVRP